MKFRTTLILLAICVVLGGYVVWSGNQQSHATPTATPQVTVLQLNKDTISAIAIHDQRGNQVQAQRTGSDWQLTVPARKPADLTRVTEVISGLASLNATRTITPTDQGL